MNKRITELLKEHDFNKTLLIGYYGGGNFGDELLLEIVINLFQKFGYSSTEIFYLWYISYKEFHRNVKGVRVIPKEKKVWGMLASIVRSKNILVGGGGIWGLDFNNNVLALSIILFLSRFLLGKKIFLVGIGYYSSTTKLGNFGAWLTAKASTEIIARDEETFNNFKKFQKNTYVDTDLAFYLPELSLAPYTEDAERFIQKISSDKKKIFLTIRRFGGGRGAAYMTALREVIKNNRDKQIILAMLETSSIDVEGRSFTSEVQSQFPTVTILPFSYNPILLYLFFRKEAKQILVISPQFHGQLLAILTGARFFPISYDNKNRELFQRNSITSFTEIENINAQNLQTWIDQSYG